LRIVSAADKGMPHVPRGSARGNDSTIIFAIPCCGGMHSSCCSRGSRDGPYSGRSRPRTAPCRWPRLQSAMRSGGRAGSRHLGRFVDGREGQRGDAGGAGGALGGVLPAHQIVERVQAGGGGGVTLIVRNGRHNCLVLRDKMGRVSIIITGSPQTAASPARPAAPPCPPRAPRRPPPRRSADRPRRLGVSGGCQPKASFILARYHSMCYGCDSWVLFMGAIHGSYACTDASCDTPCSAATAAVQPSAQKAGVPGAKKKSDEPAQ
jgi:hypothetical protein